MKFIPYGKQYIDIFDERSVCKALRSEKITTGKSVKLLEKKLANYFKSKYVAVCNSGTSALYIALLSLGIKKNSNIVAPAINFVALYNAVNILGANIYLADVSVKTGQLDKKTIETCIKKNNLKKVDLVCTMYLGGHVNSPQSIYQLKKKFKCKILEDACHALGSSYLHKNKKFNIGSCRHSDVAVFSLHPVKSITSGEGGVISTNSKQVFERSIRLRSHGMEYKKNKSKILEYDIVESSLNYRLSDINCSLAISQLNKLNKFVKIRRNIFLMYHKFFKKFNDYFDIIGVQNNENSSNHLFQIVLKKKYSKKRKQFVEYLYKKKILTQLHYKPIFELKLFKKLTKKHLISSKKFSKTSVSLPIYYDLSTRQQMYIIKTVKLFFGTN